MFSQLMCETRIEAESINFIFFQGTLILSTRILMDKLKTEDRNLKHYSKTSRAQV